jgi:hypothetical protein
VLAPPESGRAGRKVVREGAGDDVGRAGIGCDVVDPHEHLDLAEAWVARVGEDGVVAVVAVEQLVVLLGPGELRPVVGLAHADVGRAEQRLGELDERRCHGQQRPLHHWIREAVAQRERVVRRVVVELVCAGEELS